MVSWFVELSPPDKTVFELSTKVYSDSELEEIAQFEGTITELDEQYPVECVKKYIINHSIRYLVLYLGNSSIAVIDFENDGNKLFGDVYHGMQSKSAFDDLVIGCDTMEDVRKIDPQGNYGISASGMFSWSRHYTTDGYLVGIEYICDKHEYFKYLIEEIAMIQF